MNTIYYTAGNSDYRHSVETIRDLPEDGDDDVAYDAAEAAAADFHSEHDGWESKWPMTITLFASKDGPALACFEVDREYEPTFSATAKESA